MNQYKKTRFEICLDIILGIALVTLVYFMCVASGKPAELPDFKRFPDWHVVNHCYPFSRQFTDACNDSGIPAVRLTYDWSTAAGGGDRHCIVLFKRSGKLWLLDNLHSKPIGPCRGSTDLEILRRYMAGVHCMVDNVTLRPCKPRTVSELFPAPLPLEYHAAKP